MCGLFKKLGEAVKEIDKYAKTIDKYAKEFDREKEASQKPPEEPTAPTKEHDMQQILPVADVARVTGLRFNQYGNYQDDIWKGGVYTSSDPKTHITFHAYLAQWSEGYDAENANNFWNYLLEVMPNPQPVQGTGYEAHWSNENNAIIARWKQNILEASGDFPLNIMKQLVDIIFEKV